jgi:hypothetical protein
MPPEVASAYEQVTRTRLESLERRFDEHEETQATQFAEIKQDLKEIKHEISKRLPLWVTFVFSLVGVLAGALLTVAVR